MISFYPGPSRVHDEIPKWVSDAHREGILSMNHRSEEFMKLSRDTVSLLRQKLLIPKDYLILFTSSATECWEVLAQSLVVNESIHIFNGAFGAKWFDYTNRLKPGAEEIEFDAQEKIDPSKLIFNSGEVICLTQNETSNGTQVTNALIRQIGEANPSHLIAVDATSSMAGIYLDFKAADVWFASVQKCFGLPAGLAVMVLSPKAVKKFSDINEKNHYNSLTLMASMMEKWQTSFTPNVLGIYLLYRSLKKMKPIRTVNKETVARFKAWEKFFVKSRNLQLLIRSSALRSNTVMTVAASTEVMTRMKAAAKKKGILLGEGYGPLKATTFRIANFPALKKKEITSLMNFLSNYL